MKKKGFTLIELLAVIIILAIIALIATPIIMRVIENSKKAAAERSAENYVREVETVVLALKANGTTLEDGIYKIKQNGNICPDQSTDCSEENEIKIEMNGTKPSSGKIQVKNEKVIAYRLTIGGYENKYGTISRLPEEYQEVEWIGSTGTQYIDAKYSPNVDTGIEISFNFSNTGTPFGCYGLDHDERYWLRNMSKIYYMSQSQNFLTYKFSSNSDYILKMNYLNSRQYQVDKLTPENLNQPRAVSMRTLYLFAFHASSGVEDFGIGKIYYVKLTEDENLVRDFIPCYSTTTVTDVNGKECPEGTIGLYDLVGGKFYTNQGSGIFTAGPSI